MSEPEDAIERPQSLGPAGVVVGGVVMLLVLSLTYFLAQRSLERVGDEQREDLVAEFVTDVEGGQVLAAWSLLHDEYQDLIDEETFRREVFGAWRTLGKLKTRTLLRKESHRSPGGDEVWLTYQCAWERGEGSITLGVRADPMREGALRLLGFKVESSALRPAGTPPAGGDDD